MKKDFFADFKSYLLAQHKDNLLNMIGYYETILQNKEKLTCLLEDYEKYHMDIHYNEDDTEGYTFGNFEIFFYEKPLNEDYGWKTQINYHYKITLNYDKRYWGYCSCSPSDKEYIPEHDCCGDGCDWVAPQIKVERIESLAYSSFDGIQRDLWELEKEWGIYLEKHNEKIKQEEINRLNDYIEDLKIKRDKLLNQ